MKRPWVRPVGIALGMAGAAWLLTWQVGTDAIRLPGGLPVGVVASVLGLFIGLVSVPLLDYIRNRGRRAARIEALERRVAAIEQIRTGPLMVRMQFEHSSETQQVRLHVTNYGTDAEFWAPLLINGDLANRFEGAIFARWEDVSQPTTLIPRGQTRSLRIAQLDLASFPFAQWEVWVTSDAGAPAAFRAMRTSVIGGSPDAQAPVLFLEVWILSTPESADGPRMFTIALHPFEAQWLRS